VHASTLARWPAAPTQPFAARSLTLTPSGLVGLLLLLLVASPSHDTFGPIFFFNGVMLSLFVLLLLTQRRLV
jgi:hypothetical protein